MLPYLIVPLTKLNIIIIVKGFLCGLMATNMLVAISDRLWVENTGHRTPIGQFGAFWDDQREPVETMDLDDLL